MSNPRVEPASRRAPLTRRNLAILALALLTLIVGYAVLRAGHPSAAAVILVIGYCILFPLGIAL